MRLRRYEPRWPWLTKAFGPAGILFGFLIGWPLICVAVDRLAPMILIFMALVFVYWLVHIVRSRWK